MEAYNWFEQISCENKIKQSNETSANSFFHKTEKLDRVSSYSFYNL